MEANLPAGLDIFFLIKKKTITYRTSRDSERSLILKNLFFIKKKKKNINRRLTIKHFIKKLPLKQNRITNFTLVISCNLCLI